MADPAVQAGGGPHVVLAANDLWNVLNYRAGLIRALQGAGYRLTVMAPAGPHQATVERLGVGFIPVPMQPRGTSPFADMRTLVRFRRALQDARPAAFLGFTAKPNIYGSLAAHSCGIPVINNISGLGRAFAGRGALNSLVTTLYRAALRGSATVFFQNRDDQALFERLALVSSNQSALLPGSGVDLMHFASRGKPRSRPFTFVLAARLLWDKGIREFVEAARLIRSTGPGVRFQILGIAEDGAGAVLKSELDRWQAEGVIDYLGAAADVRGALATSDCVVLPSYYREGIPRILLEAGAMGIPVITSDAPGCREAVEHDVTGLLCQPRSVESLTEAMARMMAMTAEERKRMGAAGRAKMEREFDEVIVHRAYIDALGKVAALIS